MKVRITAKQTVHYDQTIEMSEEEYRELKKKLEDADVIRSLPFELSEEISDWLDLTDVLAADELEDVELKSEDDDSEED